MRELIPDYQLLPTPAPPTFGGETEELTPVLLPIIARTCEEIVNELGKCGETNPKCEMFGISVIMISSNIRFSRSLCY